MTLWGRVPVHKLRALEYLVAVVERGSFAAAARHLGLAAPSVHRAVTALERELGMPLLDRVAVPMCPLPDAEAYVSRVRALLDEHRTLDESIRDRVQAPAGTVVVAAQSVAIQFILADALPRFHERFPDVRIELRDAGSVRDIAQLRADLLLMFGWPPPQDAILRTLAHTRWLVVATPSFWKRWGYPRHPSDLASQPALLFRTPYGEVLREWTFERGRERVGVEVDGWFAGDDRRALDAVLHAGQAMARINDLTQGDGVSSGALEPVLLDWVGAHAPPANLLVRKAMSRQPRVRAFVDFLVEHMKAATRVRFPDGLPAVPVARRPEWFKRRVG